MPVKEFCQKINRGLGSIISFLRDYKKNNRRYTKAIIYTCTHNTAYDPQCDGSKAQYLWEVIQLSVDSDFIQDKVLEALRITEEGWDLIQIYELANLFCKNGNIKARQVMREQFKYNEAFNTFLGAEQIIDLDGMEGLIFVMEAIGEKILSSDEYIEDDLLLEFAEAKFGKDDVSDLLERESLANYKIKAYVDSVNRTKDIRKSTLRRECTYEDIKQIINGDKVGHVYYLGSWGRRTTEENLLMVAKEFLNETKNKKLIPYLYIFSRRTFPLDHEKIIDLALSKNKKISNAALEALSNIKNSRIHEIAIDLINKPEKELDVLPLFIKNYEGNDYLILKEIIFRRYNRHKFHNVSGMIMDIIENNKVKECLEMLVEIYNIGQCTSCRKRCIEIMIKNGGMPGWIAEEAEHDSSLEIRQLIVEYKMQGI